MRTSSPIPSAASRARRSKSKARRPTLSSVFVSGRRTSAAAWRRAFAVRSRARSAGARSLTACPVGLGVARREQARVADDGECADPGGAPDGLPQDHFVDGARVNVGDNRQPPPRRFVESTLGPFSRVQHARAERHPFQQSVGMGWPIPTNLTGGGLAAVQESIANSRRRLARTIPILSRSAARLRNLSAANQLRERHDVFQVLPLPLQPP